MNSVHIEYRGRPESATKRLNGFVLKGCWKELAPNKYRKQDNNKLLIEDIHRLRNEGTTFT